MLKPQGVVVGVLAATLLTGSICVAKTATTADGIIAAVTKKFHCDDDHARTHDETQFCLMFFTDEMNIRPTDVGDHFWPIAYSCPEGVDDGRLATTLENIEGTFVRIESIYASGRIGSVTVGSSKSGRESVEFLKIDFGTEKKPDALSAGEDEPRRTI